MKNIFLIITALLIINCSNKNNSKWYIGNYTKEKIIYTGSSILSTERINNEFNSKIILKEDSFSFYDMDHINTPVNYAIESFDKPLEQLDDLRGTLILHKKLPQNMKMTQINLMNNNDLLLSFEKYSKDSIAFYYDGHFIIYKKE